jgi:tetratricopeptide (TPR) repeat protein
MHYQEAIDAFSAAIRIKPDYIEAYVRLGHTYIELRHLKNAVEAYEEAIRLKPDYVGAYQGLVFGCALLKRREEAVPVLEQMVRIDPDNPLAHRFLAGSYHALGRYREAVEAYRRTIRIKSDDALAHCGVASAYEKLGSFDHAIDAYKEALRLEPDYFEAHENLKNCCEKLGRKPELSGPKKRQMCVLIGNFENNLNEILSRIIKTHLWPEYDTTVVTASTADEVIRLAEEHPFCVFILVLNNITVPDKHIKVKERATTLLGITAQLKAAYGKPIIAMSGLWKKNSPFAKRARLAGVSSYFDLPFDMDDFLDTLNSLLGIEPRDTNDR